jgi:hypothetical protein
MNIKKPFTYAALATLYIVCVILGVQSTSYFVGQNETIFIPMMMLGLLVLSVALMGFFFVSEPLLLALENKRKESVHFFFCTVSFFAGFVALFGLIALSLSFV